MASKNKKDKVKFKFTKELLFLILSLAAIITATILLAIPTADEKRTDAYNEAILAYNTTNSTSYATLDYENVYEDIEYEELTEVLANAEGYTYVLYGSTNVGTVLQYMATINSKAKDVEVETVYLYSSVWVEDQNDLEADDFEVEYKAREDKINSGKDSSVEGLSLLDYPALLVFNDGVLVYNSQAYTDSDQYNWEAYIHVAFTSYVVVE